MWTFEQHGGVRPDGSYSASMYGISIKRSKAAIKNGLTTIRNVGGKTIVISHRNFNLEKSKLTIKLTTPDFLAS
ncbi:hypothetical protein RBLE17_24370 [Rhodobacteraceae bacterium LE17]|jgi:hypothetical protein|nr:hypothetical protein [Rhodobacteraceae bacterium LE17]